VRSLREVGAIFRRLAGGHGGAPWGRGRPGGRSRGGRPRGRAGRGQARRARPVGAAAQARSWIAYWRDMRGVPVTAFTLSEYLPGRDLGCQSVWKDGVQLLVKTYERLSYLTSGTQAAGISSGPGPTKAVREREY